ncbi:MAG: L,D-transpeptidase family protein [Flavobacteriales bacterium]
MKTLLLTLTLSSSVFFGFRNPSETPAFMDFLMEYVDLKYPTQQFESFVYVGIQRQKLYYIEKNKVLAEYTVSTSKHGFGNVANSFRTPDGLHTIFEKIGDNQPMGTIFTNRVSTGKIADIEKKPISSGRDEITSRIITLIGEEPGINKGGSVDSYARCIYIHGTPEEGLLGQPASHGCIRMSNEDVIDFYGKIKPGTKVLILNN